MTTVKDDLDRLVNQKDRQKKPLGDASPAPGINEVEGFGAPKPKTQQKSGTGGIASPLTEKSFNDRQWHPEFTVYASDGFFSLTGRRIKSVKFTDANGGEAQIIYKNKPAT